MKKIILGTLVLLTIGMGFGFAETKSGDYYNGYNHATNDYTKGGNYDPSYCNGNQDYNKNPHHSSTVEEQNNKRKYDCIQGYQDSWERNSEVAPRTPKENSNNQ